MDTLTMAPQPVAALPSDANPSAHLAPQQMAVGISNSGSNTTTATTTMTTAPAPSSNTTTNGSISGGGGAGEGSRLSEAAAIRKELRQARIGSSSSMDSTSSNMMFRKSYPSSEMNASFSSTSVAGSIMDDLGTDHSHLTQAELEDYSRSYFGQHVFHHQKQSSYAQSEGYHSYVSSSDSSSATPFLDRLRQESEVLSRASSSHWSGSVCSSSASNLNSTTAASTTDNTSSESTSSSETLKWLGSMSDVSVSSHATSSSAVSGSVSTSQLIAHSSRVLTPKRHNSESVLYMTEDQLNAAQSAGDQSLFPSESVQSLRESRFNTRRSHMRLFPVANAYPADEQPSAAQSAAIKSAQSANWQSVADRINELERQQNAGPAPSITTGHFLKSPSAAMHHKYTFLDPSKTTRVSNPALKAIQKKAVQSYFERQKSSSNTIRDHTPVTARQPMTARPQSLPITSTTTSSFTKPVNPSRSSLPSNYTSQHFPPSSLHHSPTAASPHTATSIGNLHLPSPHPSAPIHSASVHSSPVLTKSTSISTLATSTATSHALASPPSYHATFHQSASAYNATVSPNQHHHHHQPQSAAAAIKNSGDGGQGGQTNADDSMNESGVPPPPPRRSRPMMPIRRTSSAAEYSAYRDQNLQKQSLSKDLLEAMVIGPIISLDDWVPERPPKNPALRIPSPDLPPPPPLSTQTIGQSLPDDEPLPPPPPELLRHARQLSEPDTKPLPPSRRNSFAGSTTNKYPYRPPTDASSPLATLLPLSPQSSPPPAIPKKSMGPPLPPLVIPTKPHPQHYTSYAQSAQPQQQPRPVSGMSKYPQYPPSSTQHAHPNANQSKPSHQPHQHQLPHELLADPVDRHSENSRITLRKRSHNAPLTPIEMPAVNAKLMPAHHNGLVVQHQQHQVHKQQSPPPLKPRLPVIAVGGTVAITNTNGTTMEANVPRPMSAASGGRLRSNSKASYLPRQSREKINVDPDHGVYKLTLTSNEDFVNQNNHHNNNHNNIRNHQGAYHHPINSKSNEKLSVKCNNLPDVLPIGAKIHSPSSQPPSRYGSNNNIHMGTLSAGPQHAINYQQYHHQNSSKMSQTAPPHPNHHNSSSYSMKTVFNFNRGSPNHPASPTSPPPQTVYNHPTRDTPTASHNTESILSKLVSQSNIDLMKSHILNLSSAHDTSIQSHTAISPNNSCSTGGNTQFSPTSSSRQSSNGGTPRTELGRKLSLEDRTNNFNNSPNISRSASTVTPPKREVADVRVIRKDSLKENIDKITQLQSQLMSAHLHEQDKLNVAVKRESSFRAPLPLAEPLPSVTVVVAREKPIVETTSATPPPPSSPQPRSPISRSPNKSPSQQRTPPPSQIVQPFEEETVPEISARLSKPPTTAETASQTDESALRINSEGQEVLADIFGDASELAMDSCVVLKNQTRQSGIASLDLDCQKLSEELVRQLSPNDRLQHILVPKSFRSSSFYVTGLYNPYIAPRAVKKDVGTSTPSESPVHSQSTTPVSSPPVVNDDSPPPSPHESTHPLYVAQFKREVTTLSTADNHSDGGDMMRKKEELIGRLSNKIAVLTIEQGVIVDEATANDRLGLEVARHVTEQIRPVDASKFRSYVDDIGYITNLLLSLSIRLARRENELHLIDIGDSERKTLEMNRDHLVEQLDEAKRLKEDIDRRGSIVCRILEQHLTIDEYADFDYFINTKAKLIVDAREIMDKIKMGEDQLTALKETLVHSEC